MKSRLTHFDITKGIAIWLVILGHAIQYLQQEEAFMNDHLWEFIYSFHMPLFMMISGYFAFRKEITSIRAAVKKWFQSLIVPALIASVVADILFTDVTRLASIYTIKAILIHSITSLWFLKCLFLCHLLYLVWYKLHRKNVLLFSIILTAITIALGIDFAYIQTMNIFYAIGIYMNEKDIKPHNSLRATIPHIILFAFLYFFWKGEYTIYYSSPNNFIVSNLSIYEVLSIFLLRVIIGIVGSLIVIDLSQYLSNLMWKCNTKLIEFGQHTLGIYILQTFYVERFLEYSGISFCMNGRPAYILVLFHVSAILISFAVLEACLYTLKFRDYICSLYHDRG